MDAENWRSSISSDAFKTAMRRFASSVTVITSAHEGALGGMTATAVCSATADPPSLLIVVNRNNRSHNLIYGSGVFSVNLLADQQKSLANKFASGRNDNYSDVAISYGRNGCPNIDGADAVIDCVVTNSIDLSTHTIFVGRVISTTTHDKAPLLYHSSGYGRFEPECNVAV